MTTLDKAKKKINLVVVSLLGVIFAGNLAFLLSAIIFTFIYELLKIKKLSKKVETYKFFYFSTFLCCLPIVSLYIIDLLIMKSTGDVSSIGTRLDQFNVLITDLTKNNLTLLFGNGIGNTVDVITIHRDYTNDTYFELQFLYFLNQLGIVGMFLFLFMHIYFLLNRITNKIHLLMYGCYIFYASINPYMFDTSHLVVIILLLSMAKDRVKPELR
jgi:hypothetical protein